MIYDINLIPKNKIKTSSNSNAILLVMFIVAAAALTVYGFYMPYRQKVFLNRQIHQQEETLRNYADTENSYCILKNQLEAYNNTELILDTIKSNDLRISQVLDDIENCIPRDITISSMSMEADRLIIQGISPSYTEIAGFIVNMRELDNVSAVTFMSASSEKAPDNMEDSDIGRPVFEFSVYIKYNVTDALAGLLAVQTAASDTQGEEAAPDEAD